MALVATLKASGQLNPTTGAEQNSDGALAAISVTSGNLLVVCTAATKAGSATDFLTVAATGYTFTAITNAGQATAFTTAVKAWRAPIDTTGNVTITLGDGATLTFGLMYAVYEISGHDTSTPIGGKIAVADGTTDGAKTLTLDAAPASADITLAFCMLDADAASGKGVDVGTGFTEDFDYTNASFYALGQSQQRTSSTSTSAGWADVRTAGAPTTYSFAGIAFVVKASGGTNFEQSMSGSVTPAASAVKAVTTTKAGAVTPTGSTVKAVTKAAFTGAITPVGALVRLAGKAVAGAVSSAASLVRATSQVKGGGIAPSATAVKDVTKTAFTGSITPTSVAAHVRVFLQSLAGSIASAGTVVKDVGKAVTGSVTPSSSIVRAVSQVLAGTIAAAGVVARAVSKAFAGAVALAAAITNVKSSLTADPNPITSTVRDRGHTATISDARQHTATIRSRGHTATVRENR